MPSYYKMRYHEPFDDYAVETNEPGPWFYGFLLFYLLLAFLLIVPLVSWSRMEAGEEEKEEAKDSKQNKTLEIEPNNKNPDLPTPSKEDSKQLDFQTRPESSLPKGEKENRSKLSIQNGAAAFAKKDMKKKSLVPSVVSDVTKTSKQRTVVSTKSRKSTKLRSAFLRELDQSYPDQDPDFQNRMALRIPAGAITSPSEAEQQILQYTTNNNNNNNNNNNGDVRSDSNRPTETSSSLPSGSNQRTETSSSVPSVPSASAPSAATTGKINRNDRKNPSNKGFSKLVLDVSGRRWKNRRPIGRADVIENSFASNSVRQSLAAASKTKTGESVATPSRKKVKNSTPANNSNKGGQVSGNPKQPNIQLKESSKGMSDIASSILSEQYHQLNQQPTVQLDLSLLKKDQLEKLRAQQQFQMQHQMQFFALQRLQQQQQPRRYQQPRRFSRFGARSVSEQSASVMSSILDDILPDDAADANDPGRGNIFIQPDENYRITETEFNDRCGTGLPAAERNCCSAPIDGLLLLAAPDLQKWKVFTASIPLTVGASSESLFRLVTLAFISRQLDTRSMIGKFLLYRI